MSINQILLKMDLASLLTFDFLLYTGDRKQEVMQDKFLIIVRSHFNLSSQWISTLSVVSVVVLTVNGVGYFMAVLYYWTWKFDIVYSFHPHQLSLQHFLFIYSTHNDYVHGKERVFIKYVPIDCHLGNWGIDLFIYSNIN